MLHSRGEPVYSCTGNTCTQLTYAPGSTVTTLGDEPVLHIGGEQAYYSNADPVLDPAQVNRLTITGATGATGTLPSDIIYSGLASVTVSLGNGNNKLTVDTSVLPVSTHGTGGDGGPATVTNHTGLTTFTLGSGFDQVAVPSIEGAVTVNTGGGNDTVDVGSEAGFWPTLGGLTDFKGNANLIKAALTIDGGGGSDSVTVDDTTDGGHNIGTLSFNQLVGIFNNGAGYVGSLSYSNLESLSVNLGNGGNTFAVQSTHGSPSVIASTFIDTGNGADAVYVDSVAGPTTITTDAGDDTISVGSTTGPGLPNLSLSTLDNIDALLTLDAGSGFNTLNTYDTGDTGSNTGVLTASTYQGDGMLNGIAYANVDALNIDLSDGNDHFTVASTPLGSTLFLYGGDETAMTNQTNDVIDITSTGGVATVDGGDGNDVIRVNYDEHDNQTFANGLAGTLTLHGGNGSDEYDIGLSGLPNANGQDQTIINVQDDPTNPLDLGVNQLLIYGTDAPDYFLLRANQEVVPATAMVAAFRVGSDGLPVLDGVDERVNYDGSINGGLEIFGRDGNDTFVLDDNLAPTTIFGDAGDDTFQIGQLFASPRDGTNPNNGLAPADYFADDADDAGLPQQRHLRADDDLRRHRRRLVHRLPQPGRALPLRPGGQRHVHRPRLRQGEPERPEGAVHEHQRRRRRRLHLVHGRRAGADRRRRRPRHARRPRHRVRRRLRRHGQGHLRRRPVHHVHRHREGRRRRRGGQRPVLRRQLQPERRDRARRRPRQRHLRRRRQRRATCRSPS